MRTPPLARRFRCTCKALSRLPTSIRPMIQARNIRNSAHEPFEPHFASATHFKVASQRSCPRCMSVSSLLRRPAASFPTPASSITTWHMAPRGSIATIDFGQSVVSRMIASFIQAHPTVTTELACSNRPLHMIEEGCDAGVLVGNLNDETIIARSVGQITRYPVAAPVFLSERKSPKTPGDLQRWPWLSLSNAQFGGGASVEMYSAQGEQ